MGIIETRGNVPYFKYLEITIINTNFTQVDMKRRLDSGNVCYNSVQNVLCINLLSKKVKIRIYEILPVVLYWCET
jgi:hypothetical protein